MNASKKLLAVVALVASLALPVTALAEDKPDAKAKAYPLTTCIVSGEKLDADPAMKSFSFVHEGQEIKLCCKSCKKKFDKTPETYLKKLKEEAAKK